LGLNAPQLEETRLTSRFPKENIDHLPCCHVTYSQTRNPRVELWSQMASLPLGNQSCPTANNLGCCQEFSCIVGEVQLPIKVPNVRVSCTRGAASCMSHAHHSDSNAHRSAHHLTFSPGLDYRIHCIACYCMWQKGKCSCAELNDTKMAKLGLMTS
jgi:hypothetical protein